MHFRIRTVAATATAAVALGGCSQTTPKPAPTVTVTASPTKAKAASPYMHGYAHGHEVRDDTQFQPRMSDEEGNCPNDFGDRLGLKGERDCNTYNDLDHCNEWALNTYPDSESAYGAPKSGTSAYEYKDGCLDAINGRPADDPAIGS
jgi:hypothetical protein